MTKLDIFAPVLPTRDRDAPNQGAVRVWDGFVDELGFFHKRWGLTELCDLNLVRPVQGLYWWSQKGIPVGICDGHLYQFDPNTWEATQVSTSPFVRLDRNNQVIFETDGYLLYACNGTHIMVWDGENDPEVWQITEGAGPAAVSHIAYFKQAILANDVGTNKFWWAFKSAAGVGPTDIPTFDPINGIAESSPIPIQALAKSREEIFMLLTQSGEFHFSSGQETNPFPAMQQAYVPMGTYAVYSLQAFNNTWVWFAPNRRFVSLEGRLPIIIPNQPIEILEDLEYPSDCVAFTIDQWYVCTFRQDNITLVFDAASRFWYVWGKWNSSTLDWDKWIPRCSTYIPTTGLWVVGDSSGGKIYRFHDRGTTDNGAVIRTLVESGQIDHGSTRHKRASEVRVKIKVK